jgi:hypothetical protein
MSVLSQLNKDMTVLYIGHIGNRFSRCWKLAGWLDDDLCCSDGIVVNARGAVLDA